MLYLVRADRLKCNFNVISAHFNKNYLEISALISWASFIGLYLLGIICVTVFDRTLAVPMKRWKDANNRRKPLERRRNKGDGFLLSFFLLILNNGSIRVYCFSTLRRSISPFKTNYVFVTWYVWRRHFDVITRQSVQKWKTMDESNEIQKKIGEKNWIKWKRWKTIITTTA